MKPPQPPRLTDKTKIVLRSIITGPGRTAAAIARQVGLPPTVTASLIARLINIGVVVDYGRLGDRLYRIADGAENLAADAAGVSPEELTAIRAAAAAAVSAPTPAQPAVPRPAPAVWQMRDIRAAVAAGKLPPGVLTAAEREMESSRRRAPAPVVSADQVTRPGNSTGE